MDFSNGINAPKENYGKGTKMISVMDILSADKMTYKNIRNSVSVSEVIESKNKVEIGDLVFVRSSEIVQEVGLSKAYTDNNYALYSGFSIRGKKKAEYNSLFMEINLNNGNGRRQIERKAGGSTRFNVSQEILNSIEVLLPTYEEQNKIAGIFESLNYTIALHQRKLETLTQLKKGFLQKLFPQNQKTLPKIRFANFQEEWEQRKVFDMSEITFGGGTPKTGNEDYWQGNFPWIQSSDLNNDQLCNVTPTKFITDEAINKSATKAVPANSIAVVTRVGVGKLALMPYPYATSQDFLSLSNLKVNPWFGVYSLYVLIQKEINNIQGTSIKGMTKSDLLSKNINIPFDLDEQTKIGNFFKQLDEAITLHQNKLEQLRNIKNGLLQKMFI